MKKFIFLQLVTLLILALALSPISVFAEANSPSLEVSDLLPQYSNYKWTHLGSVDYGHDMEIYAIVKGQLATYYSIEGYVHDLSGGESDADFSITLEYIVQSDVLIQTKEEETMLDSDYDHIELIRTPLEEGTNWTQEVEAEDGTTTTLESVITGVELTSDGTIFTVRYEDTNSEYYEERQIKEGVGVVYFEKLMFSDDGTYEMQYSLFEEGSGLDPETDFLDVSEDDWYAEHVTQLATLGLMSGYPDQTFRPHNEISVAEFITVTVKSLSYTVEGDFSPWYDPYISRAIELDVISEGDFDDYNRPITREEMTRIMIYALGENPQWGELDFSDADEIDSEFLPYINAAVELGLVSGYPDNTFAASQSTTRAEASTLFTILAEAMVDPEPFDLSAAIDMEGAFEERLIQDTDSDWIVSDFDHKDDVIDYLSEMMDRDLAQSYVDTYYEQQEEGLVLIPMDGPTMFIEDRNYFLERIHPRKFQLTQVTSTEMLGDYTLTITYQYENNRWMMIDRDVETHDND